MVMMFVVQMDGTKKNMLLFCDVTLTISNTTHYVSNDVEILIGVTASIENGVEIIFLVDDSVQLMMHWMVVR